MEEDDIFSDEEMEELRQSIRKGIREGLKDSGLDELVIAMRTGAEVLNRTVKILDLQKQAREYFSTANYQEAARLYTELAELDQKRKDSYLQRAQEAFNNIK